MGLDQRLAAGNPLASSFDSDGMARAALAQLLPQRDSIEADGLGTGLLSVPYLHAGSNDVWNSAFPTAEMVGTAGALLASERETEVRHWADAPQARGRDFIHGWDVRSGTVRVARLPYAVEVGPGVLAISRSIRGGDGCGRRVGIGAGRGCVRGWSARSRVRLRRRLGEYDYRALVEAVEASGEPPVMVTLTLPGAWLAVAQDCRAWRRAVRRFVMRWSRAFGSPVWLWKQEFQRRGAAHLHILCAKPAAVKGFFCDLCPRNKRGHRVECDRFGHWLSTAWTASVFAEVDSCAMPYSVEFMRAERARHLLAGTGIDVDRRNMGRAMCDPRRLAAYFLKHGTGESKEYQHVAPTEWLESGGVGRMWGVSGLSRCVAVAHVTREDYHYLRRTLRRYAASQRRPGARISSRPVGSGWHQREQGCWVMFPNAPNVLASLLGSLDGVRSARFDRHEIAAVAAASDVLGASRWDDTSARAKAERALAGCSVESASDTREAVWVAVAAF